MIDIDGVPMVPDDIRVERRAMLAHIDELEAALIRARERAAKSRANRKELLKHLAGHQASNRKLAGQLGGLKTMARTITRLTDEFKAERRWQPIETAPPNTEVLVRHLWDDGSAQVFMADVWSDRSIHCDDDLYRPNLTHWMPAPSTELPDGNV